MLSETVKSWPSQWLKEGMDKGFAKGREEGMEKGREEIACKMIVRGKSFEEISEITELSIQKIEMLASKLNNKVSEPSKPYRTRRKSEKK
jgi:predicted transposase YdaD